MEDERIAGAQTAYDRVKEDHDAFFRSRLEQNVDSAFRLAGVILGSSGDPEDATQDAIERAWRSRHTLRDPHSFDAWFQRIVVNVCRDRIRHVKSLPHFGAIDSGETEWLTGPTSLWRPLSAMPFDWRSTGST